MTEAIKLRNATEAQIWLREQDKAFGWLRDRTRMDPTEHANAAVMKYRNSLEDCPGSTDPPLAIPVAVLGRTIKIKSNDPNIATGHPCCRAPKGGRREPTKAGIVDEDQQICHGGNAMETRVG